MGFDASQVSDSLHLRKDVKLVIRSFDQSGYSFALDSSKPDTQRSVDTALNVDTPRCIRYKNENRSVNVMKKKLAIFLSLGVFICGVRFWVFSCFAWRIFKFQKGFRPDDHYR